MASDRKFQQREQQEQTHTCTAVVHQIWHPAPYYNHFVFFACCCCFLLDSIYNTRHLVFPTNTSRFFPMSNILPYNYDTQPPPTPTTHDSMTHSSSSHRFTTSSTHVSAITPPPPVTLNSHSSSSSLNSTTTTTTATTTTTTPLSGLTVAEWAGVKQYTSKCLI